MDSRKKYYLSSRPKLFFFLSSFFLLESAIAAATTHVQYVVRFVCAGCHQEQVAQWSGSHYDRTMQLADEKTILGDFNRVNLTHEGVTSYFYKKNGRFMVRTEGPDSKQQNYEIKYTFGIEPLQQYLIEFPGGRMQALSLAWDTRAKEAGGSAGSSFTRMKRSLPMMNFTGLSQARTVTVYAQNAIRRTWRRTMTLIPEHFQQPGQRSMSLVKPVMDRVPIMWCGPDRSPVKKNSKQ